MSTVTDVLNSKGRDIVTIHPAETVRTAAQLLTDKKIGAIVVQDHHNKVVGILSERDIVRAVALKGGDVLGLRVQDLMTKEVRTCLATDSIKNLMQTMTLRRHRHVPVCGEGGELTGIISIGDVVKARMGEQANEIAVLRDLTLVKN